MTEVATSPVPTHPSILTPKSGISIALAVTLVGGVAFNFNFLSGMRERMAKLEANSSNQSNTMQRVELSLSEIKLGFTAQLASVQSEIREIRSEKAMLRERLGRVETELDKK